MSEETAHSAPRLRALAPGELVPEKHSARAQLVAWLHSIDRVVVREAVKRTDGKRYVIDVFMKHPESRIPTLRPTLLARTQEPALHNRQAPDTTTERRFTEFSTLLSEFYSLTTKDHGFLPCAFCPRIVDYVFQDKRVPSRMFKWLHSDAAVCDELTSYLNHLLGLVSQVPPREQPNDCVGVQHVPELMQRFLSGESSSP